MKILGIETSCDETAAAALEVKNGRFKVLSNIVASSVKLQSKYGGIVPEVAARKQIEYLVPVLEQALIQGKVKSSVKGGYGGFGGRNSIDYIAVTNGPGLVTSLRVGAEAAKTLSYIWKRPLVTVNHMEGHIYAAVLNKLQTLNFKSRALKKIKFPALALLVSGGHTQLILLKGYLKYKLIGETLDDAVGEAFDKVAKILGLGYPGGPIISKMAEKGDSKAVNFPRPMVNSGDYNFSFSGIKTSVLYFVKKLPQSKVKKTKKDICASFEQACIEVLVKKTVKAAQEHKIKTIILGGGVAANKRLREALGMTAGNRLDNCSLLLPDMGLTGDNALMIALAGYFKIKAGKIGQWSKVKVDPNLRLA